MGFTKLDQILLLWLVFPASNAFAGISTVNNNFRIFEDTLWLGVFTLMIIAGLKLKKLAGGSAALAYALLAVTGLSGWLWKGIGLVKRVFVVNEPAWIFSLTRETFEGLTGIILAGAFLVLVISIKRIYSTVGTRTLQRSRESTASPSKA